MSYWESRQSIYYASVYIQGSNSVAALGSLDKVDCALRLYVARNAYRIAKPGDLVSAMSTVFPDAGPRMAAFGVHP
ncbi:MAG: hypothetical protein QOG03_1275, partial [Actinomycetota bacterium]|jgi:hypothetical protein|nr:hypothetical protein [Actinomycetota bacterium]